MKKNSSIPKMGFKLFRPNPRMFGKLFALFVFMIFCTHSYGVGQNKKMDVHFNNVSIDFVIEYLESATDYTFVYNDTDKEGIKISVSLKDADIVTILDAVFKDTPLAYQIKEDRIVVLRRKNNTMKPEEEKQLVVKGRVISEKEQEPIIGATVILEGTTLGVATDVEGEFSINVPKDAKTLVISSIGYAKYRFALNSNVFDKLNIIQLKDSVSFVDEVVIVGYGTTKVKDATGAVSRLGEKDIAMSPAGASVQSMLQGRAPGVNVMIQSASPTSPVNVTIRGISTLTGNTQPLWVIDGVPDYSQSSTGDVTNALFNLNLSDIESIDILKDVSATAIYGSRAANGVIIVTTKRGKLGMQPTVDLSLRAGIQTINSNKLNALNATEYKRFVETVGRQSIEIAGFDYNTRLFFNESKFNQLNTSQWDGSMLELLPDAFMDGDTDWWDEMTQNALTTQCDISVRGGTENSNYFISFGYNDQKGVVKGGRSKLLTGRLNFETLIGKQIKLGVNLSGSSRKTNNKDNLIDNIIRFRPDFPAYNEDGSINLVTTSTVIENPHLTLANRNNGRGLTFSGSAFLEWTILDGLKFKSTGTVNYTNSQTDVFSKKGTRGYATAYNSRNLGNSENNTYVWDNTLTWMKTFGKHNLVAMVGHSIEKYKSKMLSGGAEEFPDEEVLINLGSGADSWADSDEAGNTLVSAIARVNYKYNNRYLATFTFRTDGSSKFGPDKRWGYFPSGALAWVISEEEFMAPLKLYIPYLKLRASVGKIGSQNLGNYDYISLMGSASYDGQPGTKPTSLGNPVLQWEETTSVDVGLDFGLFNERLRGTIGYYNKQINNLIYDGSVPANSSYTTVNQNVGTIANVGWEFDIRGDVIRTDKVNFEIGFNIATNSGKIKKLDGIVKELKMPYYYEYVRLVEGGHIGDWYGYKYAGRLFRTQEEIIALKPVSSTGVQENYFGSYDSPGDAYLIDQDGDGKITAKDKVKLGNFNPKFFGGFNLSLSWKNLYATAVFTYSYGAKRMWYYQYEKTSGVGTYNVYNSIFDSYNFKGGDALFPRLAYAGTVANALCDLYIHDASFLRMNSLNLNYRLPANWFTGTFVNNVELSFSASNLFTITKYPGFDPQGNFGSTSTSATANDVITVAQGVDYSTYPSARTYSLGIKFTFK